MNGSKAQNAFEASLVYWGGWMKLTCDAPGALAEDVSKTLQKIGSHQSQHPAKIGKLPPEQWGQIAETLPYFLTAYLQQELARILDGPRDLLTALRLVDDYLAGQLLMALVVVAREQFLHVEVAYESPFGPVQDKGVCHLASESRPATLTIEIGVEHGEEHLPLVLHYHGQDYMWDKDESTPNNPVWVGVPVDRKGAIFTDGLDAGDKTKQQWVRDEFLLGQGFQSVQFSPAQVQRDPFACAAKAVELITGKSLTKGRT